MDFLYLAWAISLQQLKFVKVLNLKPIHKQGCVHRQLWHVSLSGSSSCWFACFFSDATECVQILHA